MSYNTIPFLSNPFFWVLLTAIFFSAAVSKITTFTKKARNMEKARNRKWILICIYFSLSIIFLLCAIFVPGPRHFLDARLLYLFAGAAAVFFLVFRFKKSIGLPLTLLFIMFVILLILFFQSITAFTGETKIATIRVLEAEGGHMKIEITRTADKPAESDIIEMAGSYIAPVVKIIIFEDYLVFLGARTWYRFVGISSFKTEKDMEIPLQADRYQFRNPPGISESLYSYFEKNEKTLPGVKSVQVNMDLKLAKSATDYSVMLQNDGGVEIVEK